MTVVRLAGPGGAAGPSCPRCAAETSAVDTWESWVLHDRGLADSTARAYRRTVMTADRWLRDEVGGCISCAAADELGGWLRTTSVHGGTRNNYRSALLSFYTWAAETGLRDDNPAETIPTWRKRTPLPKALTPDEVREVLAVAEEHGPMWVAAVTVLAHLALRVTEARTLRWSQFTGPWLEFVAKGRTERVLPVSDHVRDVLAAWEQQCPSLTWVFPSPQRADRPLCYTSFYDNIRLIGDRAGVDGLHPHRLRHSAATRLLEQGVDVRVVQEILGHANIATTSIYLRARPVRLQAALSNLSYTST